MKRNTRKEKIVIPESISQHIEEEFKRSRDFRRAYMAEITKLSVAYKIAMLRRTRHLTQAQLARRMRTTQQTVSRLEDSTNREITISTLSKAAIALKAKLNIDFIPGDAV